MWQTWYYCSPDTSSIIRNKLYDYSPINDIDKPRKVYEYEYVCC